MKLVVVLFFALLILHQDFWNWDQGDLLLGLFPVGLAYHAAFSVLCAALGALAVYRAWPADVESQSRADGEGEED